MSAAARTMALEYLRRHPGQAAKVLERAGSEEVAALIREAPAKTAAAVMAFFAPHFSSSCLLRLPEDIRSAVLLEMPATLIAPLLRLLDPGQRELEMGRFPADQRGAIERVLEFPEGSAGALADPAALALQIDLTVQDAINRLRTSALPVPSRLFVVDRSHRLLGSITPADLLAGERDAALHSLEPSPAHPVSAETNVSALGSEQLPAGPIAVVDAEGIFVGAIDEGTVHRIAKRDAASALLHPAAAIGELYWLGLRDIFGGFDSGSRSAVPQGGLDRADH